MVNHQEGILDFFKRYTEFTKETGMYPGGGTGSLEAIVYCATGLGNEIGELQGKLKKIRRGDGKTIADLSNDLIDECGDVIWYFVRLMDELGLTIKDVLNCSTSVEYPSMSYNDIESLTYCSFRMLFHAAKIQNRLFVLTLFNEHADDERVDLKRIITPDLLIEDMGQLFYFISCFVEGELHFDIKNVIEANIKKLKDRKARGVIKGDGDKR